MAADAVAEEAVGGEVDGEGVTDAVVHEVLEGGEDAEGERCLMRAYSLNPAYAWQAIAGTITGKDIGHASGMRAKKKKK